MKTALRTVAAVLGCCALLPALAQPTRSSTPPGAATAVRAGDYIAAVVNQELVTAYEVDQRMARAREEALRNKQSLPDEAELRRQVLESLIEDRAILSTARDSGARIDDADLDRAVASIAAQNQMTLAQLRQQLAREGLDLARFRANVRDQMMVERVREREVAQRIRITDSEIDDFIDKQRGAAASEVQYNVAQILVTVPEGASEAVVAELQAKAQAALARVRGGEAFATVAKAISEDANKENGGEIGLKPADRLPDVFLTVVRTLTNGEVAPTRCGHAFFKTDHSLFATDAPFCSEQGRGLISKTIAAVNALEISAAEREKIFSGNARSLLKL